MVLMLLVYECSRVAPSFHSLPTDEPSTTRDQGVCVFDGKVYDAHRG